MTRPDNKAPATQERPGARHQEVSPDAERA
jgi:hypothetical protein